MKAKQERPVRNSKAAPVNGSGQRLYAKACKLIPGGNQLLSKRPELFLPELWPAYYARAEGAEVWDLDNNRYVDFTHCGVGTCTLGYADPEVNAAVVAALQSGSMATLNCPEEVALAELLIELHPWAEMARFGRSGGEAMAIAVRIARAATGRDRVVFCGYHGWSDWYLAANIGDTRKLDGHMLAGLDPAGVPRALQGNVLPFRYNRIDELEQAVAQAGSDLAAVALEPRRDVEPEPGFLQSVKQIAHRAGAVLIFDEITSAWRMTTGGIHLALGVTPDVAVFAKAMSNGYPMAAVIGVRDVMEAAQDTFISSAYWTERVGPAAALATIRKHRHLNVPQHLIAVGERLQAGWQAAAQAAGLRIIVSGIPPLVGFRFGEEEPDALITLFTQEMLDRGFLAASPVYAMLTHSDRLIETYLDTVFDVFMTVAAAQRAGNVHQRLGGPVKHTGFQRLN